MKKLINQKGTAAVEFALVLPLLMVIVFGIIDFSFVLYDKQIITNASREGARVGIVAQSPRVTDPAITTVVNNYVSNHLITFGSVKTATTTIARTGLLFGDNLTVTVKFDYRFLVLPKFISTLTGVQNLNATTVMRME